MSSLSEPGVEAPAAIISWCRPLHDPPALDGEDLVGGANGGEPVATRDEGLYDHHFPFREPFCTFDRTRVRPAARVMVGSDHGRMRLTVAGASVQLDSVPIVTGADLVVADGRLAGLVGPNGCGKSTPLAASTEPCDR
ncbi:MAG: hypothetical protein ACRDRH_06025 [Pseudonocardia sp.]